MYRSPVVARACATALLLMTGAMPGSPFDAPAQAAGVDADPRIVDAAYAQPVTRYGHFAPGRPHEYARLTVSTSAGERLALDLPADRVFEDVAPRLVELARGEGRLVLAIVSDIENGSRLALIALRRGRLELAAQSPPIGRPMRWLNPVAVADLDGDGRTEIAAVTTPHIGGTLRLYRRRGPELVELASMDGFSNHVYGSPELGLSTIATIEGHKRLVIPDTRRRRLRIVGVAGDQLVETGQCALPGAVTGAIRATGPGRVSVGLASGRRVLDLAICR